MTKGDRLHATLPKTQYIVRVYNKDGRVFLKSFFTLGLCKGYVKRQHIHNYDIVEYVEKDIVEQQPLLRQ